VPWSPRSKIFKYVLFHGSWITSLDPERLPGKVLAPPTLLTSPSSLRYRGDKLPQAFFGNL
jgi:hypothetical protein